MSQTETPPGLQAFLRGGDRFEKKADPPGQTVTPDGEICLIQTPDHTFQQLFDCLSDGHHGCRRTLPADAGVWFCTLGRDGKGRVENTDFSAWMRDDAHLAPEPNGCFGTAGRPLGALMDTRVGRCLGVFATLGFFCRDVVTDVQVVIELLDNDRPRCDATASTNAAYASIGIVALLPVFQSLVDVLDKNLVGWRIGLPLNFTCTRMLCSVWKGASKDGAKRTSKATSDAKLFEATLESTPQLFVQAGVVAAGLVEFDGVVVQSLALSVGGIAHATALKLHAMHGLGRRWDRGVVTGVLAFVCFGADSTSRAIAVCLTVARHGMGIAPFAPHVGVWIGLEVVCRGLSAG